MPTYVYKFVDTDETIEVQQSFTDDSLREYTHPETGEVMPVKKVFQPVGVTFKGSGFFKTDSRSTTTASSAPTSTDSSSSTTGDSSDSGSSKTTDSSTSSSSSSSTSSTPASSASTSSTD